MREVVAFEVGARCRGCGHAPRYRTIVYAPLDEVRRRALLPEGRIMSRSLLLLLHGVQHVAGGSEELVVKMSVTYACGSCWPELERALGQGPSWVGVNVAKLAADRDRFVRELQAGRPFSEPEPA